MEQEIIQAGFFQTAGNIIFFIFLCTAFIAIKNRLDNNTTHSNEVKTNTTSKGNSLIPHYSDNTQYSEGVQLLGNSQVTSLDLRSELVNRIGLPDRNRKLKRIVSLLQRGYFNPISPELREYFDRIFPDTAIPREPDSNPPDNIPHYND